MCALRRDRRASVGLIVVVAMPVIIGATALAVDVGSATLAARRLQGIADAAALAAAVDPAHATAAAERAVAAAGWGGTVDAAVSTGHYRRDASVSVAERYTASASPADAAQVTLSARTPTFFGRVFGMNDIAIARTATAAQTRMASFAIGSRLASLDGGVANALLSALTGSTISLKALDYQALASADVDLFGYLDAVRTQAHVSVDDYDDLLDTSISVGDAIRAAAHVNQESAAVQALEALANQVGDQTIKLGALIELGPLGGENTGPADLARVNVMSLVSTLLQRSSENRRITLDLGASIPGLAKTKVTLALGDSEAQSPWIAIADSGVPIVRTAQARLYVDVAVGTSGLPLVGGLVNIHLPLFVELASAEARLDQIDCPTPDQRTVTLGARGNPGTAAIASVDPATLADFRTPVTLHDAVVLDTWLVDLKARTEVGLGAAEQWQSVRFEEQDIRAGTVKTIDSSTPVGGVAQSLTHSLKLTPEIAGLPLPVGGLLGAVTGQLNLLAPTVDSLLGVVTGAAGVHYGEADLRVTGAKCGIARLVA